MSVTIKPKRSDTSGNSPTAVDGEFSIQRADKRILVSNSTVVFDAFQNTASNIAITTSGAMQLAVGNSTVNVVANATSISLANSTVTWTLIKPTAAQVTDTGYYPASDGTWKKPAAVAAAGGSNTNIQYNDSTTLNGSNNLTWDKSSNTMNLSGNLVANADYISVGNSTVNCVVNSTAMYVVNATGTTVMTALGLQVPEIAAASVPATVANSAQIMTVTLANMQHLAYKTPLGLSVCQPIAKQLGMVDATIIAPGNTATSLTSIGTVVTVSSTLSQPAPTTTSSATAASRTNFATAATNNSVSGFTTAAKNWWKGNAAGAGGFYAMCTFTIEANVSQAMFVGFSSNTTAPANGLMSSTRADAIGVGNDNVDANLYFMEQTASGGMTKTNIGPKNANRLYTLIVSCPPNGGPIYGTLIDRTSFTAATLTHRTFSTAPPANTTFLAFQVYVNNDTQNAARNMSLVEAYLEGGMGVWA